MEKSVSKKTYRSRRNKRAFNRYVGIKSFTGPIVRKKFEISFPLYAVQTSLNANFYSWGTGSSAVFQQEWLSAIFNTQEFFQMVNQYGLLKLNGIKLSVTRTVNAASVSLYQAPDVALMIGPQENNTYLNKKTVYANDNAFRIQPINSEGKPQTRYYRFDSDLTIGSGYTIAAGGKGGWLSTNGLAGSSNYIMYVGLGHDSDPILSGTGNIPILNVMVTAYMSFCLNRQRLPL